MQLGGDLVAALLALIGAIVWLVRLEGRITRAEERHTDLKHDVDDLKRELKGDLYQLHKRFESGKVYVFRRGKDSPEERGDDDA